MKQRKVAGKTGDFQKLLYTLVETFCLSCGHCIKQNNITVKRKYFLLGHCYWKNYCVIWFFRILYALWGQHKIMNGWSQKYSSERYVCPKVSMVPYIRNLIWTKWNGPLGSIYVFFRFSDCNLYVPMKLCRHTPHFLWSEICGKKNSDIKPEVRNSKCKLIINCKYSIRY
jgi:hypothetical protein